MFLLTSRNEGTPVALIEAMAAGVPGVSTDVGGVSDVIDCDGGRPAGAVRRCGGARRCVGALLADPALRGAMGVPRPRRGRSRATASTAWSPTSPRSTASCLRLTARVELSS